MPRIKTSKKLNLAATKTTARPAAAKKPDKVAAVNARIDKLVATLNKMLNADVEPGE